MVTVFAGTGGGVPMGAGTGGTGGSAGTSVGTGGTISQAGAAGSGGRVSCGDACSVPPGRPVAMACPATDVSRFGPVAGGAGGASDGASCTVDADCTGIDPQLLSTHCLNGQCGPDQCLTDSDCPTGQACGCASQFGGNAVHTNRCVASNCRVDKDCGQNGVCSAIDTGYCGSFDGFYCHMPDDQCHTDVDCTNMIAPRCTYIPMLGHWACEAASVCAG